MLEVLFLSKSLLFLVNPNSKASYCLDSIVATLEEVSLDSRKRRGVIGFILRFFGVE